MTPRLPAPGAWLTGLPSANLLEELELEACLLWAGFEQQQKPEGLRERGPGCGEGRTLPLPVPWELCPLTCGAACRSHALWLGTLASSAASMGPWPG